METKLKIEGMTCEMCVAHVTKGLKNAHGVQDASVDLKSNSALVNGENLDLEKLIEAVREEGYDAEIAPVENNQN